MSGNIGIVVAMETEVLEEKPVSFPLFFPPYYIILTTVGRDRISFSAARKATTTNPLRYGKV